MGTAKLVGWTGSNVLISVLQNNGGSISTYVGDVQGVDNIETQQLLRLYETWLQQKLWTNHISLLAGLYDISSEFDVIESASLFIQSSQGMGGDFGGSGLIGPPIFPVAGLGFRIKVVPERHWYFQTGIFDGAAGTPNNVKHPHLKLSKESGFLVVTEIGLLSFESSHNESPKGLITRKHRARIGREVASNYKTKIALGAWSYSKNYVQQRYNRADITVDQNRKDKGVYVLVDRKWHPNANRPYQQLAIYGQLGKSDTEVSRFQSYLGGGITFKGLIPGDQNGLIGFSVASVQDSNLYQRIYGNTHEFETVLEWSYLTKIIPWLNVQPDVQYVISPGAAPHLKNAWFAGLRTDIIL